MLHVPIFVEAPSEAPGTKLACLLVAIGIRNLDRLGPVADPEARLISALSSYNELINVVAAAAHSPSPPALELIEHAASPERVQTPAGGVHPPGAVHIKHRGPLPEVQTTEVLLDRVREES